jgi:hypothetical protein
MADQLRRMTEEELKAIEERRAAAVEHLKPYEGIVFAATNENAVTITLSRSSADVDQLIAEVRRLHALVGEEGVPH